jgi:hypothetical protein
MLLRWTEPKGEGVVIQGNVPIVYNCLFYMLSYSTCAYISVSPPTYLIILLLPSSTYTIYVIRVLCCVTPK